MEDLNVSDEKKKYIVELLNPVLEELVAECISKAPADPVPFILQWLEKKMSSDQDKQLSPDEMEKIAKENKELKENMKKVKVQIQEAAQLAAEEEEDEKEEEDESDDEPPPDFFKEKPSAKMRQSVSAEAYGEWNKKKVFVPPVIPKDDEQNQRLAKTLKKSFMFASLEDKDMDIVIGAMKEVKAKAGDRIIKQGDSGDFLFVVEKGKLDCVIKKGDGEEVTVKTCTAGDVFGEMALLYNAPRAANVDCNGDCVLWQLDRDTFSNIVSASAQKKRARYDAFLSKVPLLTSMDAYERSQLADALKVEIFGSGDVVTKEGDKGDKFYIIEEGQAVATKEGKEVMQYGDGDYFGELALIRKQPRAATVTAKSKLRCLSVDSRSFKRLLSVQDLLERSRNYT